MTSLSRNTTVSKHEPEPLPARLVSIDFVRGIGIVSFTYWHAANYFCIDHSSSIPSVRFTLYATGLFIFTAGLLIGLHYDPIFQALARRKETSFRLIARGVKLILIFLGASALKNGIGRPGLLSRTVGDGISVLYTQRWDLPLQILTPIAGLLISAPILLWLLGKFGSNAFGVVGLVVITMDVLMPHPLPYFWHYYFVGFVGVWSGSTLSRNWSTCSSKVRERPLTVYVIPLTIYLILQSSAVISESWYDILLYSLWGNLAIIASFFIAIGLPVFYFYDLGGRKSGFVSKAFVTLGRHTLLAYLLQVCLLNVLRASKIVIPTKDMTVVVVIAAVVGCACMISAYAAQSMGPRSRRFYSFLLG